VPGNTKGTAATTAEAFAAVAIVLGWSENMPVTKVASSEERVVLTTVPFSSFAVRETIGIRMAWSADLDAC